MKTLLVLLIIICILLLIVGIFLTVIYFIKNSRPYKEGLSLAEKNINVLQYTGHPIKVGFLVLGTIEISNGMGKASFSIPISGSIGSGKIYIKASREDGIWSYSKLTFVPKDVNLSVDLINK